MLGASLFSALLALANLALTARLLVLENFGLLVLVQAYIAIVSQLVGFKTWGPLIKYGADAIAIGQVVTLQSVIRIAFWIDVAAAVVSFGLAVVGARLLAPLIGFSDNTVELITLYALTILLNVSGFAMGVLRLFDRFDLIAIQQILSPLIRFGILCIGYLLEFSFHAVLATWVISEISGCVLLTVMGLKELHRQKLSVYGRISRFEELRGFFSFLLSTNLDSSIRMISRELDVVLVGLFVDKSGAGIYKLVVQLAGMIGRFTSPLSALLLPIFSRQAAMQSKAEIRRLVSRINWGIIVIFVWIYLVLLAVGEPVLLLFFGEAYQPAFGILLVYMVAAGLGCILVPIVPLMQAYGKASLCLRVQAKATLVYFILMLPLIYCWGVIGAAVAAGLYNIIWFLWMRPEIRRVMG